jgi:hypothetical protein
MAGTRVLFASIGASLALVATAALSLLAVSAVFSFGGWSDSPSASIRQPALVFAGPTSAPGARDMRAASQATGKPILLSSRRGHVQRAAAERSGGAVPDRTRSGERPMSRTPDPPTATPGLNPPVRQPAAATAPASSTAAAQPATVGNGVRKLGENVSSTVQNTGTAVAQATAPLLSPVSAVVQKVVNAVAALLNETTAGVGGVLDTLLPPK